MKTFFAGYPFSPKSGKITEQNPDSRTERYYKNNNFTGQYFDIVYEINEDGEDVSFNISTVKL
jgi:hypothetical protein